MFIDERLLDFIGNLREAGMQVSIAESKDSLEALKVIPLERKTALKDSLKATLVKSESDGPVFDAVFDEFFAGSHSRHSRDDDIDELGLPLDPEFAYPEPSDLFMMLKDAVISGTDDEIMALAGLAAAGIGKAEGGFGAGGARPISAMAGPGYYVFRAMEWLDFDANVERLEREALDGELVPDVPPILVLEQIRERFELFGEALEREMRRRLAAARGKEESTVKRKTPTRPEEIDFTGATLTQVDEMKRILPALARRLAARLARKRESGNRGRVDIRNTLRHSLSYGGAPLEVKYRKRVPSKPELFVLCDVSGSVRTFSTFTLQLVYSLHQQFRSVRSFAFIDRVDEVTDFFNCFEVDEAVERVYRRGVVVDGDGHTDIGRALELFYREFHDDLTPRSTVLILSDARNNNRDPRAWALERTGEKVRHIYWLNPEPRERWDTGDSIMAEYADHCYLVRECRNLKQLADFVSNRA